MQFCFYWQCIIYIMNVEIDSRQLPNTIVNGNRVWEKIEVLVLFPFYTQIEIDVYFTLQFFIIQTVRLIYSFRNFEYCRFQGKSKHWKFKTTLKKSSDCSRLETSSTAEPSRKTGSERRESRQVKKLIGVQWALIDLPHKVVNLGPFPSFLA